MIQFVLYLTQDQMDVLNAAAAAAGSATVHDYAVGRLALGPAQVAPAPRVALPAELETKTADPAAEAAVDAAPADAEVTSEQQPAVARRRARG